MTTPHGTHPALPTLAATPAVTAEAINDARSEKAGRRLRLEEEDGGEDGEVQRG